MRRFARRTPLRGVTSLDFAPLAVVLAVAFRKHRRTTALHRVKAEPAPKIKAAMRKSWALASLSVQSAQIDPCRRRGAH